MRVSKSVGEFTTPWGVSVSCVYRQETNDWNTAVSCLVEDEYRIADLPVADGATAIDIGGHIGGATLALLSRGFRVITVEPLPENMDMIAESVDLNGWSARWTSIHGAIAGVRGKTVKVAYGDTGTVSGSHHQYVGVTEGIFSRSTGAGQRTVEVDTVSIGELIEMLDVRAGWIEAPLSPPFSDGRCAFLKIDVEGAEWSAFSNVTPDILANIDVIAGELHPLPGMKDTRNEFNKLLYDQFRDFTTEIYPYTGDNLPDQATNFYYKHR